MSKKVKTIFSQAKIKQIMQKDDEVGKISASVPIMIARATELFLKDLVHDMCQIVETRGGKSALPMHL